VLRNIATTNLNPQLMALIDKVLNAWLQVGAGHGCNKPNRKERTVRTAAADHG